MTRYTVVWHPGAQDELAEIWLNSSDRVAVTLAASGIDRDLAQNAETKGIELSEGLRALFAPPLRVVFTVRDDDRIVEVLRVVRL